MFQGGLPSLLREGTPEAVDTVEWLRNACRRPAGQWQSGGGAPRRGREPRHPPPPGTETEMSQGLREALSLGGGMSAFAAGRRGAKEGSPTKTPPAAGGDVPFEETASAAQ